MIYLRGKDARAANRDSPDQIWRDQSARLITSYWASRLKVWVHNGQVLQKGERIGRICWVARSWSICRARSLSQPNRYNGL